MIDSGPIFPQRWFNRYGTHQSHHLMKKEEKGSFDGSSTKRLNARSVVRSVISSRSSRGMPNNFAYVEKMTDDEI